MRAIRAMSSRSSSRVQSAGERRVRMRGPATCRSLEIDELAEMEMEMEPVEGFFSDAKRMYRSALGKRPQHNQGKGSVTYFLKKENKYDPPSSPWTVGDLKSLRTTGRKSATALAKRAAYGAALKALGRDPIPKDGTQDALMKWKAKGEMAEHLLEVESEFVKERAAFADAAKHEKWKTDREVLGRRSDWAKAVKRWAKYVDGKGRTRELEDWSR